MTSTRTYAPVEAGRDKPAPAGRAQVEPDGPMAAPRHSFAAVAVEAPAVQETAAGPVGPEEEERPSDTEYAAEAVSGQPGPALQSGRTGVRTMLRPGRPAATYLADQPLTEPLDRPARTTVAPGGTPATNASAADNECLPSTGGAVLDWTVVSADDANWRVDVTSLTLKGQINIKPWPSHPDRMVVPNTPNAVDGGNINNTAGSSNRWQAAIDDMADYDNATGGGAGANWHSTAASTAHENAHWTGDYVGDAVSSATAGNWPGANTDLDALKEPKASSATEVAAKPALQPKVNTRLATWRSETIKRWNVLIDTTDKPGKGGRGYAAGVAVLNGHITAVRDYARTKGWTGTP